ncbi:MAG: right-handed parallel beta-helix repeat-containing protein [Lachnospiraceae bacterium]|nr:right-handed parallel beta-helix repeat-containing protein [Lachnospiraceae bacterium]
MGKSFAKNRKILAAVVMAVGMMITNTGCTNVSNLLSHTSSENATIEEVSVKSVSKLLDAIKPNTNITLKEGDYNFSTELKELYGDNGNEFNKAHKYVKIEATDDGYQVIVENVSHLTIECKKDANVEWSNSSAYASVMKFVDCKDISISDVSMTHSRHRENANGDVLSFKDCENIELKRVNLSGAEGYGITLTNVTEFTMDEADIFDCAAGALNVRKGNEIAFDKCFIHEMGGTLIKASGSEISFDECSFFSNDVKNQFINKDASNNITFNECIFGYDEATALNYGVLEGEEGYIFDAKCEFEEEPAGPAAAETEYYVDNLDDFFKAIGPDRTITVAAGEYNFTQYFDAMRSPESWSEDFVYVYASSFYGGGYEIQFFGCNNMSIVGEGDFNSQDVKFVSDFRDNSSCLVFSECHNIRLNNIEFTNQGTHQSYESFLQFYSCKNGELNAIKSTDVSGNGIYAVYCEGDWFVYDTVLTHNAYGPADIQYSAGNWYFDGCTFIDNEDGFNFRMGYYFKTVSFKNCTFGYDEWMTVECEDAITVVDCIHDDVTDRYMLADYENLTYAYVDTHLLCDRWYGYLYQEGSEIYDMPGYDEDGNYRFTEAVFCEDGSGLLYIDDANNPYSVTWGTYDEEGYINTLYILVYDEKDGKYHEGDVVMFTYNDDSGIVRMQIYYNDIYYLLW